jgi:phage terminase large subunit-like protein
MMPPDPTTAYARRVVAGGAPAGRLVRLACERHLRDLEGEEFAFDLDAVDRAVKFFSCISHSKGEWAGEPFVLEPWQIFIVGSLIGWKRPDGTRRFGTGYLEIPRKNGKSTLLAGLGLYGLVMDREPGAEIYCAATMRDQAKIVWGEAARMRDRSPLLAQRVRKFVGSLVVESTSSRMVPLGADADVLDGLNPQFVIIDELHAHRTRAVLDVMDSALGARRQPLLAIITTAGSDRASVCWEQHSYAERVLAGTVADQSLFAYIATIDEGDDWRNEAAWRKANPNFGISVKPDYIARRAAKAEKVPAAQNSFRRLHLNEWTEAVDAWLTAGAWEAVQESCLDVADYRGAPAWAAVDISSRRDLTALVTVVEDHGRLVAFPRFWMPGEGALERSERDGVDYATWRDMGLITATPGPVVDVAHVAAALADLAQMFDLQGVAGDAYRRAELQAELDELGCEVALFDHPQGFRKAPATELWMPGSVEAAENAIVERTVRVASSPLLTWNIASITMTPDAQGNRKPDKRKATGRIDGAAALIMALGLHAVRPEAPKRGGYFPKHLIRRAFGASEGSDTEPDRRLRWPGAPTEQRGPRASP